MTKAELIDSISERANLSKVQARQALEAFTSSVVDALKAGNEVRLVGFGAFSPVRRKSGMARNPRTGAAVQRPASNTCRFRPGDSLKAQLNG
jgi:DNA-binding protein HU-beta